METETAARDLARFSNWLQNEPFTVREPTVPPFTAGNTKHYNRESIFGVYVQDDWKMKSNLTVNVGLRYEMSTIPYEINGKFILLPTLWTDPGNCSEDINGLPIAATCSGLANKVFDSNPTLQELRTQGWVFLGSVQDRQDHRTRGLRNVRCSSSTVHVWSECLAVLSIRRRGRPDECNSSCVNPVTVATAQHAPSCEVHLSRAWSRSCGVSPAGTGRWQYTDRNPKRNYVMQWNFNVQRQITPNSSTNSCLCRITRNP